MFSSNPLPGSSDNPLERMEKEAEGKSLHLLCDQNQLFRDVGEKRESEEYVLEVEALTALLYMRDGYAAKLFGLMPTMYQSMLQLSELERDISDKDILLEVQSRVPNLRDYFSSSNTEQRILGKGRGLTGSELDKIIESRISNHLGNDFARSLIPALGMIHTLEESFGFGNILEGNVNRLADLAPKMYRKNRELFRLFTRGFRERVYETIRENGLPLASATLELTALQLLASSNLSKVLSGFEAVLGSKRMKEDTIVLQSCLGTTKPSWTKGLPLFADYLSLEPSERTSVARFFKRYPKELPAETLKHLFRYPEDAAIFQSLPSSGLRESSGNLLELLTQNGDIAALIRGQQEQKRKASIRVLSGSREKNCLYEIEECGDLKRVEQVLNSLSDESTLSRVMLSYQESREQFLALCHVLSLGGKDVGGLCTKVIGRFPDLNSADVLACADRSELDALLRQQDRPRKSQEVSERIVKKLHDAELLKGTASEAYAYMERFGAGRSYLHYLREGKEGALLTKFIQEHRSKESFALLINDAAMRRVFLRKVLGNQDALEALEIALSDTKANNPYAELQDFFSQLKAQERHSKVQAQQATTSPADALRHSVPSLSFTRIHIVAPQIIERVVTDMKQLKIIGRKQGVTIELFDTDRPQKVKTGAQRCGSDGVLVFCTGVANHKAYWMAKTNIIDRKRFLHGGRPNEIAGFVKALLENRLREE